MNLTNKQLKLAGDFISKTHYSVFLTGKAGTGKTTFLRNLANITYKRFVVVAPTGVAAINAGGVTVHSFFQLPFGPQLPETKENISEGAAKPSRFAAHHQRFTREKINIIRSLDLLVIDEISMVRADMLDAIDAVLRRFRQRQTPFGGVQLLMIGDLQQLAPIVKDDEWELLHHYYDTVYFFSSLALKRLNYVSIELQQVFRQADPFFLSLLNKVRNTEPDQQTIEQLNQRYNPELINSDPEGYITLTTHNNQAARINEEKLLAIKGKTYTFTAMVKGDFAEFNFPTEQQLQLKIGAQVMFVKNDPSPLKTFFNGKIGKIVSIDDEDEIVYVQCEGESEPTLASRLEWHNTRYSLNEETNEIKEDIIGSFKQIPLKLAWAITIHKSQGLTFDKAIIDAASAFAHGQVYVALSRCRTFEGMLFRTRIPQSAIKGNNLINGFMQKVEANEPDDHALSKARNEYQLLLVKELFDFKSLGYRLNYMMKICNDNRQSIDNQVYETIKGVKDSSLAEISKVAEKFHLQIEQMAEHNPDLENNSTLQERLIKGCAYFLPLLKQLHNAFDFTLETDNKAVRTSFNEAKQRFILQLKLNLACLEGCAEGFTVQKFLATRAIGAIEKAVAVPALKGAKKGESLYNQLKKWRELQAEEEGIDARLIIPMKVMQSIAEKMPTSARELLEIKGLSQTRVRKYGIALLEIIEKYSHKHQLGLSIDFVPIPEKQSSKSVSLLLLKEGNSIEEIAEARNFAISTIQSHLSEYIQSGELDINGCLPKEKIELISDYFIETEDARFGPAREVLGDEITYGDLKMVYAHLINKGLITEEGQRN